MKKGMTRTTVVSAPEMPLERLLTIPIVAECLGKTVDATRKMVSRGQIPGAVRLGRAGRVRQRLFQQFLDALPTD